MSLIDQAIKQYSRIFEDADSDLYRAWEIITMLPKGRLIFSKLIGLYVPYTGSISPYVEELEPGHATVRLRDRRKVRNHLNSIHAIALANLVEMTGNLAVYSNLPQDARIIPKEINVKYEKKARGNVVAESRVPAIDSSTEREMNVEVTIRDENGDVTTRGTITILVGPKD